MTSTSEDIEIFGVYDRGISNQERIVLRVNTTIDLSGLFLVLGFVGGNSNIFPIKDQFLWLGNVIVDGPGWVFIYTGEGTTRVTREINTNEPLHCIYWNKSTVVLSNEALMPALCNFLNVRIASANNKFIT